jgi:hypothetical protein
VIQTAAERPLLSQASPNNSQGVSNSNSYAGSPAPPPGLAGQSGRGTSVVSLVSFVTSN